MDNNITPDPFSDTASLVHFFTLVTMLDTVQTVSKAGLAVWANTEDHDHDHLRNISRLMEVTAEVFAYNPDTLTVGQAYDMAFRIRDEVRPLAVEVDTFIRERMDGYEVTSAEVLDECLAQFA